MELQNGTWNCSTLGKKLPISHFTREDLDKLSNDLRSGTAFDAGNRLRPNFGKLALRFLLGDDSISCLRHLTTPLGTV
jgi:hypothetical protein